MQARLFRASCKNAVAKKARQRYKFHSTSIMHSGFIMFSVFDPLMDFNCPHCQQSLRWRRVTQMAKDHQYGPEMPYLCPLCAGKIVRHRHPAISNNWLWSRFYLPGVFLCTLGIFVPALGWILPFAVGTLLLGLLAMVIYIVRERWGWKHYLAHQENP